MKPVLVGITGGIGSGKSVVRKVLEKMGYPTYDADREAGKILAAHPDVIREVKNLVGNRAYGEDGTPDRSFIASAVFGNSQKLQELNRIIHPRVKDHFNEWVQEHKTDKILFKEAAIMFESGSNKMMDTVIAVVAPESLRMDRIMGRDRKSREEIMQIMEKQLPEEELISKSDFLVRNDEHHPVIPQILKILDQIRERFKIDS